MQNRLFDIKTTLIRKLLEDLREFQRHNSELRKLIGEAGICRRYPYLQKSLEAVRAVAEHLNNSSASLGAVEEDIAMLCAPLHERANWVFRDAITDNTMMVVESEDAWKQLVNRLTSGSSRQQAGDLLGRFVHIDFAASNQLVTKFDDRLHITTHQMCQVPRLAWVPDSRIGDLALYYRTMAVRMLRAWSRRCIYRDLPASVAGDRFKGEEPDFYLIKVFESLASLRRESSERFPNLHEFLRAHYESLPPNPRVGRESIFGG